MANRPDLYVTLIMAVGVMFAGAWLGRSDAVLLGLGLLIFTSVHEHMKP